MNRLKYRPVGYAVALLCAMPQAHSQTQPQGVTTSGLASAPSQTRSALSVPSTTPQVLSTRQVPSPEAQPASRLRREAPPNFSKTAALIDRTLVWRGERKPAIVFVAQPGNDKAYALVPASAREFRGFLLGLGFERQLVEAYLRLPVYPLGEPVCLSLEAAPETCINVFLQPGENGEIDFVAQDADRKLVEKTVDKIATAVVGSAQLSLGMARTQGAGSELGTGASSQTDNFSFSTRGVVSRSDTRLEYDFTGSSSSGTSQRPQAGYTGASGVYYPYGQQPNTTTRINLLAAGKRLGPDAGTAYAGLFQSDTGQGGAGGNLFLLRPTLIGLAWKSDGGNLSSFGARQRVRVLLLSPSYVRIFSQGGQVFEGQLPPGEKIVSFSGYGQPFVDVVVRDTSGVEQRQRVEVLPPEIQDAPVFNANRNPHGFYVDVGQQVLQGTYDDQVYRRVRVENGLIASAGYTYGDVWGNARAGLQAGQGFTRLGGSLADRTLARQASAMVGTQGERGAAANYSPSLENGFQPSVSATVYKTGANAVTAPASVPLVGLGGFVAGAGNSGCTPLANSLQCYALSNYNSWTAGIGHREFPLRFSYSQGRVGQNEIKRAVLQSSFRMNFAGLKSNLLTMLTYDPGTKAKSLLFSLVVPLENASTLVTSSASTDLNGNSSLTSGYSKSFTAPEQEYLRSVSLSGAASQSRDSKNDASATAYVSSQFGPVANTALFSKNKNSTAAQTTLSMDYALTSSGASFTREDSGRFSGGGLFDGIGLAGVSIANHSQDPQTALVGGFSVDVPPGTSVYVPTGTGYQQGVTVSPGPALSAQDAKAGQYLYKGNVKTVVIADGFWVLARFSLPDGKLLPGQFTYKRAGEKLERLYMDSKQQSIMYEVRDEGSQIERFVTVEGDSREYRCVVPQSDTPQPGESTIYKLLTYTCNPSTTNIRKIVDGQPDSAVPQVKNIKSDVEVESSNRKTEKNKSSSFDVSVFQPGHW